VVGDLHLHPFARFSYTRDDGRNSWVAETMDALAEVYLQCRTRGIKHVILAGDVFHVGDRVYTKVFNELRRFLLHQKVTGFRTILIAGNHDQIYRGSTENVLMGLEDVVERVVSTPVVVESSSYSICFIPYTEDEKQLKNLLETWLSKSEGRTRIVVGHLALQSDKVKVGRFEFTPESQINPELFKDMDLTLLGHYHTSQGVEPWPTKIIYVGSLTATNFGDAGSRKGFMTAKIGDDSVTFDFVPVEHTRFEVLTSDQSVPDVKGSIIRVDYIGVLDEDKKRRELLEVGARAVVFNCTTPTVTEIRVAAKDGKEPTVPQYMQAYIDEHGEGFDKGKLLQVGLKFMESNHGEEESKKEGIEEREIHTRDGSRRAFTPGLSI